MTYASLDEFLSQGRAVLSAGPIALLFDEDLVEIAATITHHQSLGFANVVVFTPKPDNPALRTDSPIHIITYDTVAENATVNAINRIIPAAHGAWLYYCFNAEFLYFPFSEHRTVGEMLAFHAEERRDAMLSYVVDLYATDLAAAPNAVSLTKAQLDRSGYYALARPDEKNEPKERQLDFFGGLRWRYEEHIPQARRRIDRISIFRAKPGLEMQSDHTFNDEEYNTYACPWHNNITAAVASFRTAKALKSNAGSAYDIDSFHWHNSQDFEWTSDQLLHLGLMEPGQWF